MAITAIVGRPGQGKSVYLVHMAQKYLRKGYYVFSNIELKTDDPCYEYIESLDHLIPVRLVELIKTKRTKNGKRIKGIKIVVDELQVWLNSRNWDKLDPKIQLYFQQHRKRGMDIFGATQSIKRADVVFRELIQYMYRIQRIAAFSVYGYGFGFFYLWEYDPDTIEEGSNDMKKIGWPMLFFADPILLKLYDTTQEYELANPVGRMETRVYVYEEKTEVIPRLLSKDLQPIKARVE